MSCEQKVYEAVIKNRDALFPLLFKQRNVLSGPFFVNLSVSAEEVPCGGLWSETNEQKVIYCVEWI